MNEDLRQPKLDFKVVVGRARPNKGDGTPCYEFRAGDDSSPLDLETLLNRLSAEGWQLVTLALPTTYPEFNNQVSAAPATVVFSRPRQ